MSGGNGHDAGRIGTALGFLERDVRTAQNELREMRPRLWDQEARLSAIETAARELDLRLARLEQTLWRLVLAIALLASAVLGASDMSAVLRLLAVF